VLMADAANGCAAFFLIFLRGCEMEFATVATREPRVSGGLSSYDADKERVRQATDIVDLVGGYFPLRRAGSNFVGLCPWHDDTKPSLQVNPSRQSFRCWVCDIGGDVFSFIMRMEGVEFPEAMRMLAERVGIELKPRQRAHGAQRSDGPDLATLRKAMTWTADQYHRALLESDEAAPAREYIKERGITDEMVEQFQIGFAPLSRDWLLRRVGGSRARQKMLETIGVLAQSDRGGSPYDRFRGRLLFTINDEMGRQVGLGGRLIPGVDLASPAKYVNSPETPLFTKNRLLYGLDKAKDTMRRSRRALVMEGYTDVIAAHQFGITDAVAVLGTALGENHLRVLRRYVDRIVLLLDGDEAGQRRTTEVLEMFISRQVDLRVVTLPEGSDPCDFLQTHGADAMRDFIEANQVDALEHAFRSLTEGIDPLRDLDAADRAMDRLLRIIASAPKLAGTESTAHLMRETRIIARLAMLFRMEEQIIRDRLVALRRENTSRRAARESNRPDAAPQNKSGYRPGGRSAGAARPAAPQAATPSVGEPPVYEDQVDIDSMPSFDELRSARPVGGDTQSGPQQTNSGPKPAAPIHPAMSEPVDNVPFDIPPEEDEDELFAPPLPSQSGHSQASPALIELMEILIVRPEYVPQARDAIDPKRLAPSLERDFLEASIRLAGEGISPDFMQLMNLYHDPAVQTHLVKLGDLSEVKGYPGMGDSDIAVLIEQLIHRIVMEERRRVRPGQLGAMRDGNLDAAAQNKLLLRIIQQEQDRQDISDSTDG